MYVRNNRVFRKCYYSRLTISADEIKVTKLPCDCLACVTCLCPECSEQTEKGNAAYPQHDHESRYFEPTAEGEALTYDT